MLIHHCVFALQGNVIRIQAGDRMEWDEASCLVRAYRGTERIETRFSAGKMDEVAIVIQTLTDFATYVGGIATAMHLNLEAEGLSKQKSYTFVGH